MNALAHSVVSDNGQHADSHGETAEETGPQDLTVALLTSLAVLDEHTRRVTAEAETHGWELSQLDVAIANVGSLIPLLLEDYETAWNVAEVMRVKVHELERDVRQQVAGVLRSPGGVILPS